MTGDICACSAGGRRVGVTINVENVQSSLVRVASGETQELPKSGMSLKLALYVPSNLSKAFKSTCRVSGFRKARHITALGVFRGWRPTLRPVRAGTERRTWAPTTAALRLPSPIAGVKGGTYIPMASRGRPNTRSPPDRAHAAGPNLLAFG